ncbi:hypothetical protein ACLMJK_005680 [Lecanora helva]
MSSAERHEGRSEDKAAQYKDSKSRSSHRKAVEDKQRQKYGSFPASVNSGDVSGTVRENNLDSFPVELLDDAGKETGSNLHPLAAAIREKMKRMDDNALRDFALDMMALVTIGLRLHPLVLETLEQVKGMDDHTMRKLGVDMMVKAVVGPAMRERVNPRKRLKTAKHHSATDTQEIGAALDKDDASERRNGRSQELTNTDDHSKTPIKKKYVGIGADTVDRHKDAKYITRGTSNDHSTETVGKRPKNPRFEELLRIKCIVKSDRGAQKEASTAPTFLEAPGMKRMAKSDREA